MQMAKFKASHEARSSSSCRSAPLPQPLFFTWQNVPVDYGRSGIADLPLDGWDAWGLLLGLLVMATVTLVVLLQLTDLEMSEDIPWSTVILGLGAAVFAVAVVKSLTDAGSTWQSYAFVGLAAAVAAGAYLDWAAARRSPQPLLANKRRGISSAA